MIALPAYVIFFIFTRKGRGFTCFTGIGGDCIRNLVLFSLGLANLWLQDDFLFGDKLLSSKECRVCDRSSQIKGRWTAWGPFDIKQGVRGVGGLWAEKLVSQQSLLNEVN